MVSLVVGLIISAKRIIAGGTAPRSSVALLITALYLALVGGKKLC
jgi:hypothetical protein